MPAFAEPWNEYTLEEARREFPPPAHPYVEYFKHLSRMYEGEAVLAWEAWERIGADTQAVGDDPIAPARREVVVAPPGGKTVPTGRHVALAAPEPEGRGP